MENKILLYQCPGDHINPSLEGITPRHASHENVCIRCHCGEVMLKVGEYITIEGCIDQLCATTPVKAVYGEYNLRLELCKFFDGMYDRTELVPSMQLQEDMKELLLNHLRRY